MLRSLKDLEHYAVCASDGHIGKVADFLLDDQRWTIRYLVVETDHSLNRPPVLISPISLRRADWATRELHVALTRDKVKHSPTIDAHKPVSRQHERDYDAYYGYSCYWGFSGVWGISSYPGPLASEELGAIPNDACSDTSCEVHLRSANELSGYHVQGSDDAIGHLAEFIVDDESWEVRYLVIDTSNWWLGKKVLVAPHWASRVSWDERKVYFDMSREAIKNSPEWNASDAVNREYETRLYDYHGRPVYWEDDRGKSPASHHEALHP